MRGHFNRGEEGFTLVEILASLVVLAVAGLAMTAYFSNALTYAKGNQNKTVMINLARNTLFYMQKQANFDEMRHYFKSGQELGADEERAVISSDGCSLEGGYCTQYENLVTDAQTLAYILNPVINGITYRVDISYQEELFHRLDQKDTKHTEAVESAGGRIGNYLLPIKVEVSEASKDGEGKKADLSKRHKSEVEGYITDEAIR